jgi:hypothetical protein
MVWELAKELDNLGQDIIVISPYNSIGRKGETNCVMKYSIECKLTIDVYAPERYEIGLH